MSIELLAPCGSCIGEQDIDVIGVLADLLEERLDAFDSSGISGDGDGLGTRLEVRKSVQRLDGRFTGLGLAGGDEDLGGAGLKETRDINWLAPRSCHAQRTLDSRRSGIETQATRSASDHSNFALEGEEGSKTVQLNLGHFEFVLRD